jgi:hypothetical protein
MLGRKNYRQDELDQAKTAVGRQLAAYARLVEAIDATADANAQAALAAFEPLFLNHMTLALDRYFVHRIRPVAGKDGNPLNEVELMADSLITNEGVLRGSTVIKLIPAESVVQLEVGDRITLSASQFEQLSQAFFRELETRFL